MSIGVVIYLADTLRVVGLRSLLKEYFDISPVLCSDMSMLENADNTGMLIITSASRFGLYADYFFPRRARILIIPDNDDSLFPTGADEGTIVEIIRNRLDELNQSVEADCLSSSVLSPREERVLVLVARGFINKEIADMLGISLNTVLTHRKNIMAKLGIRSVSGLSLYALMNGYVTQNDIAR